MKKKKEKKVHLVYPITIPRADEVLDTPVAALVFLVFNRFRGDFTQVVTHPDASPQSAFCTPNGSNEWLCMPQGATSVLACFFCIMLLTAALDMIQKSLEDAIGSDDSPFNYVAALPAFLARLRPHKSELSPNKTRSELRESNSWATSSLKMVSVLTMTKSPSCLACLCLRTSNSSAAYLMVLVITSSPCQTWPGAYA